MDNKLYVRMNCDWKSREEYENRKKQEKVKKTFNTNIDESSRKTRV